MIKWCRKCYGAIISLFISNLCIKASHFNWVFDISLEYCCKEGSLFRCYNIKCVHKMALWTHFKQIEYRQIWEYSLKDICITIFGGLQDFCVFNTGRTYLLHSYMVRGFTFRTMKIEIKKHIAVFTFIWIRMRLWRGIRVRVMFLFSITKNNSK